MEGYRNKRRGFTLVELMVVVGIIGVLSSVIFVATNSAREQTRDNERQSDLAQIKLALRLELEAGTNLYNSNTVYDICSSCSNAANTAVQTYVGNVEDPRHGTTYYYYYDDGADEICANQLERTGTSYCIDAR